MKEEEGEERDHIDLHTGTQTEQAEIL